MSDRDGTGRRRLAVVGLGGMGGGMARCLLDAGFPLTVYNRTSAKAAPLVAAGATSAASPADAADADVVLVSLSDESAVDDVVFAKLVPHLRPGTVVIDTSTVSPTYARQAAARLEAAGHRRLEACVVGNPPMALAGKLRVFAAGEERDVEAVRDVLDTIGQEVRHVGAAGQASILKLAFNLLLGAQTAALAEAVAFCQECGIDRDTVLGAIRNSGWNSPVLQFRAEFMRTGEYAPAGFRASLMAKDLRLVAEETAGSQLRLPVAETAGRWFTEAVEAGLGDQDAAVIAELATAPTASAGTPSPNGR